MDVSVKTDRERVTDIVQAGEKCAAWIDDGGVAVEIEDVFDCETEDHLEPLSWAEDEIWKYERKPS